MRSLARLLIAAIVAVFFAPRSAAAQQTLRAQFDQRGSFVLLGNSLGRDCAAGVMPTVGTVGACGTNTADSSADVFWRSDSPAAGQATADNTITPAQARSTAVLAIPAGATLTYARLYWSAENATAGTTAVIERAGVFTNTVTADVTYLQDIGAPTNHYQASADVTAIVRANGPGAYRVGNVATIDLRNRNDNRAYVAWSMVVFYNLPSDPPRNLTLFDGFEGITTGMTSSTSVSGFVVPASGFDARVGIIVYEGDTTITGDQLRFNTSLLTNALNPMNNFFNGTRSTLGAAVTVAGDLPQFSGAAGSFCGADLDVFDGTPFLMPAATSANVVASSTGDFFVFGGFVTAIATLKPLFTDTVKSFTNLTSATGIFPGDVIEYSITTRNTGSDTGVNVVLTDALPMQVTYVPGSLRVTTGANVGAKTDAAGDDQGEYVAATRTIVVRLGTGANATTGGSITTAAPITTVTFRVTINAGTSGALLNQALVRSEGEVGRTQGIGPVSFPSGDGSGPNVPTQFVVNACATNADCRVTVPRCNTTVMPRVCAVCTNDTHCVGHAGTPACEPSGACGQCSATNATACTGATPVCNVATATCVGCRTNADCGGGTPICDTTARTCRPCGMDSDCGGATPACQATTGRCGQCSATNTTACTGATPICDVAAGVCTACRTNADCGGITPICDTTLRVCRPCTNDSQCGGATPACGPTGRCGQCSATNMTACTGATPICDVATTTCIGCRTNADCSGATPICDATARACRACGMDSDCGGATPACQMTGRCGQCSGTNMTACTGATPICDATAGVCVSSVQVAINTPFNGSTTSNNRPPITGTTSPGATVAVTIDGGAAVTVIADAMGNWSVVPPTTLPDGMHTIAATAMDASGRTAMTSSTVTVDTTAPAVAITTPADGSTTSQNRPMISGTSEPNATISVAIDGGAPVTVTVDATGHWTLTPAAPLSEGPHGVTATVTDFAGNRAVARSSFTVDSTAPAIAIATPASGSSTPERQPPITGTSEPGAMVSVTIDGGAPVTVTADASGHWTLTPATPLTTGPHTVTATTSDPAGNTGRATTTFTVDPDAPPLAITAPTDGGSTSEHRPPITGTTTPGGMVQVSIDGGAPVTVIAGADGTWSVTPTMDLADGPHMVHATTMATGGTASADVQFTVDSMPPAVMITAPATGTTTTNNRTPITGTAEPGATVTVSIDGTVTLTTTADATGLWSVTPTAPLADGMHMATATARDAAGNAATSSTTFTVDTTAPAITIETPASGSSTPVRQPPITGTTDPNATVAVVIDGNAAVTVTADATGHWTLTPTTPLINGQHTVTATTSDAAGNTARATSTFTVDPAAPMLAITTPADGSTINEPRPAITGTTTPGGMVQVSIDGGAPVTVTADATGHWSLTPTTPLSEGRHQVTAVTAGPGNNQAIATSTFTVDTTAPQLTITTPANGSTTSERRPVITGTATPGAVVTVTIDTGMTFTVVADATGTWRLTPPAALAEGPHMVSATTQDAAGNTARAMTNFTIGTGGCRTNADCPAASPVCNTTTGVCGPCRTNADCTMGGAPVCSTSGACVQCTTTSASACTGATPACGPQETCVECTSAMRGACASSVAGNACVTGNRCGCTLDGDCPAGARCNTTAQRCESALTDAGPQDARFDAARDGARYGLTGDGACGCRTAGHTGRSARPLALGALAAVLALSRRRRRKQPRA